MSVGVGNFEEIDVVLPWRKSWIQLTIAVGMRRFWRLWISCRCETLLKTNDTSNRSMLAIGLSESHTLYIFSNMRCTTFSHKMILRPPRCPVGNRPWCLAKKLIRLARTDSRAFATVLIKSNRSVALDLCVAGFVGLAEDCHYWFLEAIGAHAVAKAGAKISSNTSRMRSQIMWSIRLDMPSGPGALLAAAFIMAFLKSRLVTRSRAKAPGIGILRDRWGLPPEGWERKCRGTSQSWQRAPVPWFHRIATTLE